LPMGQGSMEEQSLDDDFKNIYCSAH